MKIDDFVTFIGRPEDRPYLKTTLLDVSMRLFKDGTTGYAKAVKQAAFQIGILAVSKFEDYPEPFGMSGANAGIPWNIIAIVTSRKEKEATAKLMLNPKLLNARGGWVRTTSNCGSIRLLKPIRVDRHAEVEIGWYDLKGAYHQEWFNRKSGSFTLQHEIEHNQGILITDLT